MANFVRQNNNWKNDSRFVVKWTLTDADPNGEWLEAPSASDKTVHVIVNGGSGTVAIQGSNETATPVNPITMRNENRDQLLFPPMSGIEFILPNTLKVRPIVSGGSGNNVDVYLCVNGS